MLVEENEPGSAIACTCENAQPATSIEWAQVAQKIELPFEALVKMHELADAPPPPSARLLEAARRYKR
jgi:hypothetical protein